MKKFLLFCFMLLTLGISGFSQETTVTIGTGTSTTYTTPFDNFYKNSWVQMIYPAAEINEAGFITSLSFNVSEVPSSGSYEFTTLTIYLGTTSDDVNATTSSWLPMSELTEVYSTTSMAVPSTTGWLTFQLDTPFPYDGSENLVIVTSKTMPAYCSTLKFYYTSVSNTCLYRQSDSDASYATHPGTNTGTLSAYRSNLQLTISPNGDFCRAVKSLTASQNTTSSITLSFISDESQNAWTLSYHPVDDTDNVITIPLTDTIYTVNGLNPNTFYSFSVTAGCTNGLTSVTKTVTSMTLPADPATLPYNCDFEDATENANWAFYNGEAANYWMVGDANGIGGTAGMMITNDGEHNAYYYDSAAVVYAVRDIYLTPGYDNYAIEFDWKAMGQQATDYLRLYIGREPAMVTPNTTGTVSAPSNSVYLTVNGNGSLGLTPEWKHTNLVLDSTWSGNTMRLYFTWVNNAIVGNNPPVAIDNIHVTGHSCPAPTLTHFYDSIPGVFTLTWSDDNNAGTYEVALIPFYGDPNLSAITVNDMEYTFTDVATNQPYTFYIRSVCSSTEKSRWMSYNLGMNCDMITSLPYEEYFDTYGTPASGLHTECMTHRTNYTSTAYPYISSTQRASGIGSLYFYGATATWSYVALPQIDVNSLDITEMMLSLKAYITSTTTTYGRFDVGVMTDPMDETTFTTVKSFYHDDFTVSTWMDFDVYFNNYTGNGEYIAIRVPADGSNYIYIDNVVLKEVPSCSKPTNLTVSNISDNSANISWTAMNPADGYELAVLSPAGAAMETATIESTPLTHTVLNDLTANTDYLVYVRGVCGSDYTEWAGPLSVRTKCLPVDELPYEEGFEGIGGSGAAFFPGCWTRRTNSATLYPYVSTTYHATGTSSLYFYASSTTYCMAASQGLDLSQGEGDYILTFKLYKTSSSYGRLDVGVMTDPDNMNTLTVLKSFYPTDLANASTWYEFQVVVPAQTEGTSYLVFYMPQGAANYLYLDDVKLDVATCSSPSGLTVSNVTGTSAIVSWTAAPVAVEDYTLEYTEEDMEAWTPIITGETTAMISGLTQGTVYQVRLYSNCLEGNADTLTTSFSTSVYMACQDPDTVGTAIVGGDSVTTYYVPVNNLYKYTYSQQIYTADEINPAHTPTVITALAFKYNYATAMTDKVDVDIYLAHRSDSTFSSTTDWTPISSAQLVYHGDLNCSQGWNVFELDNFFSYNGTDNLVVIVDDNSNDYNSSSCIFGAHTKTNAVLYTRSDSQNYDPAAPGTGTLYSNRPSVKFFTCEQTIPVTCAAPSIYNQTADDESITLSWIPGLSESAWELRYKAAGETDWNTTTVNASPYTIDNLEASTEYLVEMRSDCGGEYSEWVSMTISTTCANVSVPFTENFENTTGGTTYANFVNCWSRGTNNSSSYPYVVSTQSVSGMNSLYFYGTSTTYCYAATPRFEDDVQMDSLLVTFQARKSTESYFIEVGIMTDPNDYSTFQLLGSFTPSEINNWEMAEVKTNNYTGDGRYVAFRIPSWITSYMWVDDVMIDFIPQCQHVENLEATNITANEATISWTPGGDETEWMIVYALAGTINPAILEDADFTPVYSDSVVLTDLTSNTQYDVFVKASCSNGESSVVMSTTFYTACTPFETLPYSMDFDNYTHTTNSSTGNNNVPNCWDYRNTGTSYSAYPYVYYSSSYAHSGNYSLAFYTYTSSTYSDQYAFLPEIDLSALSFENIALEFFMRAYSTSYTFQLIVGITEGTDISTFEAIDTLTMSSTSYAFKSVEFAGYTGTGNRIVLLAKKPASGYNYGNLDDISLVSNTCPRPEGLAVSDHDASSVTLQWTEVGSATSWNIEYGLGGFAHGQGTTVEVTNNPYTITGLESGTQYEFYVQSVCGPDDISGWALNSVEVNTDMVAVDLPYATDFEEGSDAAWMMVSGGATNKWRIGPGAGTDNKLFVSNSPTSFSYAISSASSVYAQKLFTMGMEDSVCVSFDVNVGGESSYDYVKVLLIPTTETIASGAFSSRLTEGHLGNYTSTLYAFNFLPYDAQSTGSLSATYPCIFNLTGNQTVHIEGKLLNPAPGAEAYLVFYWNNDATSGTAPGAIIDNISVRADSSSLHSCTRPGQLSVDNITTSSATISWTSNAPEFTLYYKLSTSNTYDSIPNITQNTYTLTNLMAGVEYDFYVLGICSDGEELASSVLSFPTQCGAITIPYTQNFDNQTTGSGTLPQCWSRNSTYNATTPYISTSYHNSGNASLYFYCSTATDNMVVLPPVDPTVNPVNTLQLSFVSRATSLAPPHFVVGVMTDPNDATTFVGVDTITHTVATQFEPFEVPLSSYSGTGTYVAIYYYCSGTATSCYVDDVVLEEMPSCPKPIHLAAMSATTSTIALTWESFGATSWEIAYGAPGFDPDAATANVVTANTNPFTVSNLSTATSYEFYVRAICSNAESSPWSASLIATTTCDVISTFPYTEGFEAGGSMPACWSQEYVSGSLDWQFQNGGHSSSAINAAHSGSYNAYLFTTSDYTTKLVSPIFDLSNMTDVYVTFWHAQPAWTSDQDQLTVYYRTSPTAQWTQLEQYTTSLTAWTFDSIALPNPSATYQLAFEGYATYGYGVDLDDITVNGVSSGPVITNPTVATNAATGIGQTAATLNATITNPDNVTITAKGFEWKTTTGGTYTQIAGTGTGNTFTADLTTLTPGTSYTFKAFITYNGTTTYGQEMTFTTQQQGQPTEPSATTADATNVTYNSATLNGSVANPDNVTITAQGFQWKVTNGGTYTSVNATGATMTYNLTGLDASTGYTFRAFVTTANGTSYGQEKTFTTGSAPVEPCDVPTGLTVTDVQSESISVTWDNAAVLRWNVQYGPVGGTLASATASTNSYTFTNLNPLTTYQIQVQAVCEEGNVSEWSPAVEATTTNLNSYLENNVTLYPNPAKEFVDVRIDGDLNVTGMEVYDVYGKLINTINVIDNTTHINVSGLANGMYFVRVTTEQGVVTKRFVKR